MGIIRSRIFNTKKDFLDCLLEKNKKKERERVSRELKRTHHYSRDRYSFFLRSEEWAVVKTLAMSVFDKACLRCKSSSNIQVDHIIPVSRNPRKCLDITNLQPLCSTCNGKKGNLLCTDYRTQQQREKLNSLNNSYVAKWAQFFPLKDSRRNLRRPNRKPKGLTIEALEQSFAAIPPISSPTTILRTRKVVSGIRPKPPAP